MHAAQKTQLMPALRSQFVTMAGANGAFGPSNNKVGVVKCLNKVISTRKNHEKLVPAGPTREGGK